jgi:hypothetical protein
MSYRSKCAIHGYFHSVVRSEPEKPGHRNVGGPAQTLVLRYSSPLHGEKIHDFDLRLGDGVLWSAFANLEMGLGRSGLNQPGTSKPVIMTTE